MSAQHTPGPWKVATALQFNDPRPYTVYRDAGSPHYVQMLDKAGRVRKFATKEAARAAIAKATGATHE